MNHSIAEPTALNLPAQGTRLHGWGSLLTGTLAPIVMLVVLTTVGCADREKSNARQTSKSNPLESTATNSTRKHQLQEALARGDWAAADGLARAAMLEHPADPDVLKNAAIVAGRNGRLIEAAELASDAVKATTDLDRALVSIAIRGHMEVGQLFEAIELLRWTLKQHPGASDLRRTLVGFLGEAQLADQIPAHMPQLIRARQFDSALLVATTDTSRSLFAESAIEVLRERNPQDYRLLLGQAKRRFDRADFDAAADVLRAITNRHPSFLPAHALLARSLAAHGDWEELQACLDEPPAELADQPDYWFATGDQSENAGDLGGAITGYARATRLRPNDSAAWIRLIAALKRWSPDATIKTNDKQPLLKPTPDLEQISKAAGQRVAELLELRKHFFAFTAVEAASQKEAVAVATSLLRLGRHWEAEAWSAVATTISADPADDIAAVRQQCVERLASDPKLQSTQNHPELVFDLSPFTSSHLAEQRRRFQNDKMHSRAARAQALPIRLEDQSASWQLNFLGKVGDRVTGPHVPLSQTTGCGGGAIDFDRDGKTDLFLMAAGGTIRQRDSEEGAMMRNLGGRFANQTQAVGCGDTGFGQGVAVGDYNDDGFPDLYLLNIGENRLLRNNGDGTFQDVTLRVGLGKDNRWSTSGAIVDVDRDGYCDLVSVNYCDSSMPVDQPCYDNAGDETTCHPLQFPASPDQFWRGAADGRFAEVSEQWSAHASPGRGLGLLAGMLDGRSMSMYIANDMSANHFLHGSGDDVEFKLQDSATACGIAVDARGLTQASMGMAASDLDRDSDLDFFITGFAREYNILYRQDLPGFWTDQTAAADLVIPSLQTVGFGTQAIDLDADGWDELIVANGHIGDYGGDSPPYAQPTQLFRRSKSGRFQLVDTKSWGEYFLRPHVGRALWLSDVNGDLRADVVVTHSTEPVALLINRGKAYGIVALELVGTSGSRDAIGAVVTCKVPATQSAADLNIEREAETRSLHRIAGNGYLCSNEPVLRIGIGNAKEIRDVVVQWPNGLRQSFSRMKASQHYLLVEGEKTPYPLTVAASTNP